MTCQPFCLRRSKTTAVAKTVNITHATRPTFVGNKDDFLSNERNKKALIDMITERLRQKGCHVIQAEGDADLDIVKAAVTMCISCSTTLVREDLTRMCLLGF